MNKNENIKSWIGRIMLIGLFFIAFSIFVSNDHNNKNSSANPTSIEYSLHIDVSAIVESSISIDDYHHAISTSDHRFLNVNSNDVHSIILTNKRINRLFKICSKRYLQFKPSFIKLLSYLIYPANIDKDYTLIS
jgi:hypothetical protein